MYNSSLPLIHAGTDIKIKTLNIDGKLVKLQIWYRADAHAWHVCIYLTQCLLLLWIGTLQAKKDLRP